MDPVSQTVVGAISAQVPLARRLGARAAVCGAAGGVLADAGVLIRSAVDPLFTVPLLLAALAVRWRRDLARFVWFADGFVARDPADPGVLADMRYSLVTEGFAPLWGVRLHADGRAVPVEWVELMRDRGSEGMAELWRLVTGTSPRLRAWLL